MKKLILITLAFFMIGCCYDCSDRIVDYEGYNNVIEEEKVDTDTLVLVEEESVVDQEIESQDEDLETVDEGELSNELKCLRCFVFLTKFKNECDELDYLVEECIQFEELCEDYDEVCPISVEEIDDTDLEVEEDTETPDEDTNNCHKHKKKHKHGKCKHNCHKHGKEKCND